jgi:signal peptidase I
MDNKSFFQKILYSGSLLFDLAKWLIIFLVVVSLINAFFVGVFVVDGESMHPNFKDKELVLWRKAIYQNGKQKPVRGDIVVIQYPGDPLNKKYVKRVVGMPGETVDVANGHVYVNKKLFREKYLNQSVITEPNGTWTVKAGEYFVMGDNRPNSNDSRFFGPIETRFVLGRAIGVVFPRFRLVSDI